MKTMYGKSIIEGAPFGNKNAAGPHKGGGVKTRIGDVSIERPFKSNPWRRNVTVRRYSPNQQAAVSKKTYKNVSSASERRLNAALAKEKAKGAEDGFMRNYVSRDIPRKRSEIFNVEMNQTAPVKKIDRRISSSVKFERSKVDKYGDYKGSSSKTYWKPTKSSLARVRRATGLG
jgi:hypothetical protein